MASMHLVDWAICAGYFVIVCMAGAWFSRGSSRNDEYFLAGRRMGAFPIGISLFATAFSSLSFVGLPREAAYDNYHLFLAILMIPLWVVPVVSRVFIPLYQRLGLTSAYAYLEARFDRRLRRLGSLLYSLYCLGWMGSMLYAIAMIVQVALGLDEQQLLWTIVLLGGLTTLYTTAGGFKAVVWTDVLQAFTLWGGVVVILLATVENISGGWSTVWRLGIEHNKFEMFDFRLDRETGGTFFSALALGLFSFLGIFAIEQVSVQRYVAMPNIKAARRALLLNSVVVVVVGLFFFVLGTATFAYYHQPVAGGVAAGFPELGRQDQLVPFLVQTELQLFGLMGLLLAGLFAAGMSSMAGGINTLTALLVEDWLDGQQLTGARTRWCCGLLGLGVTAFALLVPYIGSNVYWVTITLTGTLGGPLLGVFLLGILVPRSNSTGAFSGLCGGLAVSAFLTLQIPIFQWWYGSEVEVPGISYWWFSALTCLTTLVTGTAASYFSPAPDPARLRGLVHGNQKP